VTAIRRISEVLRAEGTSVPTLTMSIGSLRSAVLDHRAGFLLSLLDGATDLETLLDVCGMPAKEALGLLDELQRRGFVALRRP
jgi:hypothetical protein